MPTSADSPQQNLLLTEADEIALPISAPPPPRSSELAARMEKIEWDLVRRVGEKRDFSKSVGKIIRSAVDYVIDAPTLYRYDVKELDPDEKTAIGKRIERLLRFEFGLPKGRKLDVQLADEDVDIKTTMGKNWMFSRSSHGHMNLLLAYDESKATYKLGLAYVLEDHLGASNRDQKKSMTAEHRENIHWILKEEKYPPNFLAHLPKPALEKIISGKTGAKRVQELLRLVNRTPIPRHVICSVANQKDPLKRIRSNGGARDILWSEGILVLSGAYADDKKISEHTLNVLLADDETLTLSSDNDHVTSELVELYRATHKLP